MTDKVAQIAAKLEWQPIETAPTKGDGDEVQRILMAYFGPDERYYSAAAVAHFFKWDCMERRLASGWPWRDPEPTHWMPLPAPPQGDAS